MAVAAGKHVYCEKPVGVDVPGALKVVEIGKKAEGKQSMAVGFQIRKAPPYVELVRRIQGGALGTIGCGLAYYYCPHIDRPDWPKASADEKRLRNWVWYRSLSGDIIVEQNVHVIDICNWIMKTHPVKAVGSGSRKLRQDTGDCYDNFNLVFTYPNDIQRELRVHAVRQARVRRRRALLRDPRQLRSPLRSPDEHLGRRALGCGLGSNQAGGQFSASGTFAGALDQADAEKQKSFVESITSGKFLNETAQGADSAMACMLGRNAAYSGKAITWDELLKSKEVYDPKLDLNKLTT